MKGTELNDSIDCTTKQHPFSATFAEHAVLTAPPLFRQVGRRENSELKKIKSQNNIILARLGHLWKELTKL